ncbi:MAG: hypothetical protein JWQ94_3740 [Tardiphaga sp.]|nr:hypothetical protein [Tardiphaga sp.]
MTITDDMVTNCVRFVKWALQEGPWSGGDLDGAGVQDMAESLGLIVSVPYDPEKHGAYNDYGCDVGDPWFEFAPGLKAAALEGSVAVPAWQPIETAPKDGSTVLVWRPSEGEHYLAHVGVDFWSDKSWYRSRRSQQPTHWQPLPAPPITRQER